MDRIIVITTIVILSLFALVSLAGGAEDITKAPVVTRVYQNFILHWSVTSKNVTVNYPVRSCGILSQYVLQNVSDDAHAGAFDWEKMTDKKISTSILSSECNRLKKEMKSRGATDSDLQI